MTLARSNRIPKHLGDFFLKLEKSQKSLFSLMLVNESFSIWRERQGGRGGEKGGG
jgi:hypothetical protein